MFELLVRCGQAPGGCVARLRATRSAGSPGVLVVLGLRVATNSQRAADQAYTCTSHAAPMAPYLLLATAVAVELAAATLGAVALARLLRRDTVGPSTPSRWPPRLALVPALLVPLVVAGSLLAAPRPQHTPVAAVRGFLDQAVVNDDGEAACTYLTARARVDFEGHGLDGPESCQSFFGTATLRLGGRAISSDRQVDRLHFAVAPAGADRLVTVSSGGQEIRFRLRPADGYERQAFAAPATPWRIASSVNALRAA
jgi:hypothetical protein